MLLMKIHVPRLYSCKMESVLQSYLSGPTCNLPSPYRLRNNGIKMISVLVAVMYSIIYSLLFVKLSSGLSKFSVKGYNLDPLQEMVLRGKLLSS